MSYLDPTKQELDNYLLDLYGTCDRDHIVRNDCYWGKDAQGRDNGCLKIGGMGRRCPHWKPLQGGYFEMLRKSYDK